MIPKIIHLYWHDKKKLPYIVKKCIKNIKEKNKDFTVKLYDKKFIMSKLTNIKDGYEQFISDIFRLYILYFEGGVYLDSSILCLNNIECMFDFNLNKLQGYETPWGGLNIENYCMCSNKGNKLVYYWLIECIVANNVSFKVYKKYYEHLASEKLKRFLPYLTNFLAYNVACKKLFGKIVNENEYMKLLIKSSDINGPLYYLKMFKENNIKANSLKSVNYLLNQEKLPYQNCIIKLRGEERKLMNKLILEKKYNKNSLIIKLLFNYK